MTGTELIQITGIFLGSTGLFKLIEILLTRNTAKANTYKIESETGNVKVEGELKISEHYKKEFKELLNSHEDLKRKFNSLKIEYDNVIQQMGLLQNNYNVLQMQLDNLKKMSL